MDNSVKPIKKTFAFYKTSDNLWNSKYLASPKISRYFHEPNDAYLSGPNSPLSLSVKASVNLSDDYLKKATGQVREAKYRLHQQKLHREYLEYTSKQKNYDSDFSGLVQRKIFPDSPVNVNSWEKLNLVPKIRLQNILPAKTIRKDLQGIENILNRTQEFVKENEASEDQKQAKRLQERLFTIKRHNFCAQLEEKAGIWKVREESMNNGVFGKVKSYQVPKRIQQLSLPRKVHQGNTMERSDFRGLLNVDFREAVGKIAKEVSIDKIKKNKKEKFDLNEVQEAIFEINDFEKKFHIKSLTIS